MKKHSNNDNRDAVSEWEDDGGARPDGGHRIDNAPPARDRRRSQQEQLDASHESDRRGEHRYDDGHQTAAEQEARKDRDELKQRLRGRVVWATASRPNSYPVLSALAAAGVLVIVGGIAVTTLVIVAIIACGTRLLRAFGLVGAERRLRFQPDFIEGIVVNRSPAGRLD